VANLSSIIVLFNTSISSPNSCYVRYDPSTNTLYLLNDGGTDWNTVTPGSSAQVSNSQCTVSGTGSSYISAGNNATLNLALTFNEPKLKNMYLYASDNGGHSTGWVQAGTWGLAGLTFIPVTPCRVADTRNQNGPFGGPILAANTKRDFVIPSGRCGIPTTAAAYSLNMTAVPTGNLGYLSIWPSGQAQPRVSTLNSDGRVKANAAIVPAGTNGGVSVYVSNDSQVILDINGYFAVPGGTPSLAFYPVTPCRVADTRNPNGTVGGPLLSGGRTRTFPMAAGTCNVPGTAKAYSLNFTAVPRAPIGFLSAWPTGQPRPLVSTLNASTGAVTANAAIVLAGISGSFDVYSSDDTDVVIDINGYFGPQGAGGLSLYATTPCRVYDTRVPAPGKLLSGTLAIFGINNACAVPTAAQALVLNATVVPSSVLDFIVLWPDGRVRPLASTLNAPDGAVTSNMAIVPTTNDVVDVFSSEATHVVLDVSSYFAP
jgi:hypothetical protein